MTQIEPVRLFGIDDPTHRGDPDGLIAIAGLGALPDTELVGLVANRAPVRRRGAMARYALDRHAARTPVGLGDEVIPARPAELVPSPFELDPGDSSGYDLCELTLAGRKARSVRAFFTSPFPDAAWLIGRPHLWQAFERVAIMGGANRTDEGWVPDSAFNNRADLRAAERFYRELQRMGTPVTLVDARMAIWAKVPAHTWLRAAGSSDPWVAEIGGSKRRQWERTWAAMCSRRLSSDRTPQWFFDNWCDGAHPRLASGESITPYVTGAPAHDVLAVATLLDDQPLGAIETHPRFPNFHVLRPWKGGSQRAIQAQLRLIRAAFGDPLA